MSTFTIIHYEFHVLARFIRMGLATVGIFGIVTATVDHSSPGAPAHAEERFLPVASSRESPRDSPALAKVVAVPRRAADVWPGLNGVGGAPLGNESLPLHWSPDKNIHWRVATDSGASSPVIWKDTVYLTGVDNQDRSRWNVVALQLSDGRWLWTRTLQTEPKAIGAKLPQFANSTPVVDTTGVYAISGSGEIVSIAHGGEIRWRHNLARQHGPITLASGLIASLAQDEASVFVLVDQEAGSYLAAVNKLTGLTTWKTRRNNGVSASSPMVASIDGIPQVVTNSAGSVDSYDAQTGKLLWNVKNLAGNVAHIPFVQGNTVLIGASPQAAREDLIKSIQSNFAMQVESHQREWHVEIAWSSEGQVAGLASPVAHNGYAYWTDRHGQLTCFDLRSGEEAYCEQLDEPCDIAPLAAGGRIYLFGKHGTTTVIRDGPRFQVLSSNSVEYPSRERVAPARPQAIAVVDGSLLIRTEQELLCIRGKAD